MGALDRRLFRSRGPLPYDAVSFSLMNFFRRNELTSDVSNLLTRYDETIRRFVGANYPHPIRMRDWELAKILDSIRSVPMGSSVLDMGSFNTYLPLALAAAGYRVTASDLTWRRMVKSLERRLPPPPPQGARGALLLVAGRLSKGGSPRQEPQHDPPRLPRRLL